MRTAILLTALLASVFVPVSSGTATAACRDDQSAFSNCLDEFKSGARSTMGMSSEADRAKTVGEAVKNCWNCATETLSTQMRNFNNSDNSGNSRK